MRDEMKSRMCLSLIRDCEKERAKLYAFVVMSNHIHFVAKPHETKTISSFVKSVKVNSASRLLKHFTATELKQLEMQAELNTRQLWQVSFRANPLYTKKVADQKAQYTHLNPVRAGIVELSEEYLWSSRQIINQGLFREDGSLELRSCREFYNSLLV
jgi:putative transposase